MKTEKITARITEDEKESLLLIAQKEDKSLSQLIREACRAFIQKKGE